jgi:cytochrome c
MHSKATALNLTRVLMISLFATHGAVSALAADAPVVIKDATGASFTGDAAAGQAKFGPCAVCHKLEVGKNAIGPSLHGVFGRKAGTGAGFNYSPAMKKFAVTWDAQTIADYIENPRAKVPGGKMSYVGMKKPQDRANVVAYLKKASAPK